MEILPAAGGKARVVCIASGATVAEAVEAAKTLASQGIAMSVWNCHSLKPFDDEKTLELAKGAELIVTAEDHSVIGGLGSCVAEALSKKPQTSRLVRLGVQDDFGESGEPIELYDKHGISAKAMAREIAKQLGKDL
jgi:transketolase